MRRKYRAFGKGGFLPPDNHFARRIVLLALFMGYLTACEHIGPPVMRPSMNPYATRSASLSGAAKLSRAEEIEECIQNMTLSDKVASLFWVRPEALAGEKKTLSQLTWDAWRACPVSGVVLHQDNIINREQVLSMAEGFRALAGPGFVVGVSEEGGSASVLGGLDGFPNIAPAKKVAQKESAEIYDNYKAMGESLRDWGFNVNFAPVANLSGDKGQEGYEERMYGGKPYQTGSAVREAVQALLRSDVQPCLKYFPLYCGASTGASASRRALSLAQLQSKEWIPFSKGIEAGARIVMVGHTPWPGSESEGPACLSKTVVTERLRGDLGFNGLIVSDSMEKPQATKLCDAGELAIRALKAGCDIVVMPKDVKLAHGSVLSAVEEGSLSVKDIDESIRRRLRLFY